MVDNYKQSPVILADCDLVKGGRDRYTIFFRSFYDPNYALVCFVPPEECKDITWTTQTRQGYIKYADLGAGHPLTLRKWNPWYLKKISVIPENGSVLLYD